MVRERRIERARGILGTADLLARGSDGLLGLGADPLIRGVRHLFIALGRPTRRYDMCVHMREQRPRSGSECDDRALRRRGRACRAPCVRLEQLGGVDTRGAQRGGRLRQVREHGRPAGLARRHGPVLDPSEGVAREQRRERCRNRRYESRRGGRGGGAGAAAPRGPARAPLRPHPPSPFPRRAPRCACAPLHPPILPSRTPIHHRIHLLTHARVPARARAHAHLRAHRPGAPALRAARRARATAPPRSPLTPSVGAAAGFDF